MTVKAIVDSDVCAGCGECADICPEVFEMVEEIARIKMDVVPADNEEACRTAADACPVEAITITN